MVIHAGNHVLAKQWGGRRRVVRIQQRCLQIFPPKACLLDGLTTREMLLWNDVVSSQESIFINIPYVKWWNIPLTPSTKSFFILLFSCGNTWDLSPFVLWCFREDRTLVVPWYGAMIWCHGLYELAWSSIARKNEMPFLDSIQDRMTKYDRIYVYIYIYKYLKWHA